MSSLLSRYAECIFWLARFVERAEDLARILDVNETFSRDARGSQNWLSIVQLHADEKRFFEKHPIATADAVIRFYVTDMENPTSIISAIRAARENARTLRPLISTEMWVHLNVFYNRLKAIDKTELAPGSMTRLLSWIKESCQTHTGITEGTFFRDQGWYFYQLGRYIERADQTTRLLDIKYHLLLPKTADVGSPIDASQWSAEQRAEARRQIALYKSRLRPLIRDADLYHVADRPDGVRWDGIEYYSKPRRRGVLYAFRGTVPGQPTHRFRLQGLEPEFKYRLTFQDRGPSAAQVVPGRLLMNDGVEVKLALPLSSELIFIEEIS